MFNKLPKYVKKSDYHLRPRSRMQGERDGVKFCVVDFVSINQEELTQINKIVLEELKNGNMSEKDIAKRIVKEVNRKKIKAAHVTIGSAGSECTIQIGDYPFKR